MCSRIFFLLNELGVMRQCPLPVLPLLLLFLLRPRRSLQIEPSASAVAFSDGEGGVGAEKKKMPLFIKIFGEIICFKRTTPSIRATARRRISTFRRRRRRRRIRSPASEAAG